MKNTEWLAATVLVANYAGATWLVVLARNAYPDQSIYALTTWVVLYLFGVVVPVTNALTNWRWLRNHGVEMTPRARAVVVSPMITAGVTLLSALDLLRRVLHR